MNIFGTWYGNIRGGWKTVGAPGEGAFASATDAWFNPQTIDAQTALKLSAYNAGVRLLSETMGAMTFQLKDNANRVIMDHDLYGLMRNSPNAYQTGDGLVAALAANKTVYGNSMAHIKRAGKVVYGLDFYETSLWGVTTNPDGSPNFTINGDDVPYEDVLHWSGFSLNGYWGLPTLLTGADALRSQIDSNSSAQRTFANGLRAGGFFTLPTDKRAFTNEQFAKWKTELSKFSLPENMSKWLPLLPGMSPVANTQFRVDPVTAELLSSRFFGIEEICRFLGVPPPLIGHTDKASSWASSLDGLNQFLVTYTLLPQAIRLERNIARRLLTKSEQNKMKPSFNMDALLRGDIAKRFETYKIGIDTGMYNANTALAIEGLPAREGGDEYRTSTANTGGKSDGKSN